MSHQDELCVEVERDPRSLRRSYLTGVADDKRPNEIRHGVARRLDDLAPWGEAGLSLTTWRSVLMEVDADSELFSMSMSTGHGRWRSDLADDG
jgi:hypothetical protein